MNILFLSTENPYPPDHGHHIRTYNILKYLSNKNNVFFLGFAKHRNELQFKQHLEKLCTTVDIFLIPQGMSRWRLFLSLFGNLFSPSPFGAQKYFRTEARLRIKDILKENKIDLVHFDMLYLARYYKDVDSTSKVLVEHNVESLRLWRWMIVEKNPFTKLYLYYQYLKLRSFERRMCPKFDRCVVVSKFDKQVLTKMCQWDNFVVIPNGVDIEYFKPINTEIVPDGLVWVGAMSDPHNKYAVIYFLDRILPLIRSEVPNVQVSFVGASPMQELIEMSKRDPNVTVTGYVDDIRPYAEQAAVCIVPIRSGSGTKLKVLNALSLGKATVTTSIGAEGIEVTPGENILIGDSPEEFAKKAIYLLRNPKQTREIGLKGRRLIEEKYDWKIIGKNMDQIYENVIEEKLLAGNEHRSEG